MNPRVSIAFAATAISIAFFGCSHDLQIKNLSTYSTPLHLGTVMSKPTIAVKPFSGAEDDLFFFNALIERLSHDPGIGDVHTDYTGGVAERTGVQPDLIVDVRPKVNYRSSGWNFLINWPGFLIFTPAWNGYVYYADVKTSFSFYDPDGGAVEQLDVPMSFSLRHADIDRTSWAELSWLEVSLMAFIGGIYNANNFDRDVIPPFQLHVKDTYTNYVLSQAQARVRALVDSGKLKKPAAAPAEPAEPSAAPAEPSAPVEPTPPPP